MNPGYEKALQIARMLLGGEVVTEEVLERAVDVGIQASVAMGIGAGIDRDALLREVESLVRVWVGVSGVLDDPRGHEEWLSGRRGQIEWRFWDRYRRYLEEDQGLPRLAVTRLDDLTDRILGRLEDPHRAGSWDRRGLIAGQVQSGKTGNYIGLMCKAADAGYKLIIVLAGVHNSLRSQTQLRVDHGFIGYDTQKRHVFNPDNVWIGVGRLAGAAKPAIHSLTHSGEKGDFNTVVAQKAAVDIGGSDPVVLVVKKNTTVLKNLIAWATTIRQQKDPDTDLMVVRDVPLLVIDDEADHASINTADADDADPSTINWLIRDLLAKFSQSAYVGYTATPFANILIDPDADHSAVKDDLFPRSFIFTLKAPSNYIGPATVFGLKPETPDQMGRPGLPLVREIKDEETWMPRGHKKTWEPGPLPESLVGAIHSFVLAIAARRARGQVGEHNSMLIHVTRFVDVQGRVAEQVGEEVKSIRRHLRYGDGASATPFLTSLQELWDADFDTTSPKIAATQLDRQATRLTWGDVMPHLAAAANSIEVSKINGSAKDVLSYFEHRDGLNVIAIGGDKLSRGLTLEGLTVSYFLRASKMYDTLLQMGRWFGYRPGYLDLCRLYLSPELRRWFCTITAASEELMRLFDEMADAGGTPSDFGLKIRSNPDGLTVTSPAKMQQGKKVRVSYAGTISETVNFDTNQNRLNENLSAVRTLAAEAKTWLAPRGKELGDICWSEVPSELILSFLDRYKTHEAAQKAQAINLRNYIKTRVADGELTTWTILLAGRATNAKGKVSIDGMDVGLALRSPMNVDEGVPVGAKYDIRRIVDPPDELVDLTPAQLADALALTIDNWEANRGPNDTDADRPVIPGGRYARKVREPQKGLLILYPLVPPLGVVGVDAVMGFGFSFPESRFDSAVDYWVNKVYLAQEFQWDA